MEIYLFDKIMKVDLLCPILFISCDTPAADKLCGHYSSYGEGVHCVTCSCNVPFDNLDDPYFPCKPVTWSDMNHIITNGTDKDLTAVSQQTLPFLILLLATLFIIYMVPCLQTQCMLSEYALWAMLCS